MKRTLLLIAIISVLNSCSKNNNQDTTVAENNKARIIEFYDKVVNAHNPDMVDSFFTDDFTDPQMNPDKPVGVAGIKASFKNDFFTAFPDGHVDVHFLVASGDTVVAQVALSGTNTGSTSKMQATNKKVNIDGTAIFIMRDGKIAKRWRFFDDLLMMQQLGMLVQRKDSV
jgi:steroid delta-isomerase-like uncharacterized protein